MCSVTKMVTASSTSGIDTAIDIMVFDYTASHIITIAACNAFLLKFFGVQAYGNKFKEFMIYHAYGNFVWKENVWKFSDRPQGNTEYARRCS